MNLKLFFLPITVGGLMVALFFSTSADAGAPMAGGQAPGFYRITVGKFEVTALSDGTAPRQVDTIMSKPERVREILRRNHESLPIDLSINAFLINTGSKLILVDTGTGELFGPHSGGQLIKNLQAAGYKPEQVDAVLLTHIHGDHSGGLTIGGQRAFPHATVYVDKRDVEFWLSVDNEKAAPEYRRRSFQQARATLEPYRTAGKLQVFDGPTKLFTDIHSVPIYGHTPGHTAYLIESEGQKLLLWGDIIHVGDVQFAEPDITINYDVNPKEALVSRKRMLSEAAKQGYLVGGAHISFPGLGHIRAEGKGYFWAPIPYKAGQ